VLGYGKTKLKGLRSTSGSQRSFGCIGSGFGRAAARPGSDAWDCREVGGGVGVAATASGGEEQLRQTAGDVARQGKASARLGSGGADAGAVLGLP
jgi:hypothetical protein